MEAGGVEEEAGGVEEEAGGVEDHPPLRTDNPPEISCTMFGNLLHNVIRCPGNMYQHW